MRIGLTATSCCLLTCAGMTCLAQTAGDLAGSWRVVGFSTPSRLDLYGPPQTPVMYVGGWDNFSASMGSITVQPDGAFSGFTPEPASGVFIVTGQGMVDVEVPGEGSMPFRVSRSLGTLASAWLGDGAQDLNIVVKTPGSFDRTELYNSTWSILSIETPAALVMLTNMQGRVVGLGGADNFLLGSGSLSIDGTGALSGVKEGPFTGTWTYADGIVNASINAGLETFNAPLAINGTKDLMVTTSRALDSQDNYQELILFLRRPAATTLPELQGVWRMCFFEFPSRLICQTNLAGEVLEISGRQNFKAELRSFIVGHDGFFTARLDQPATGTLELTTPGDVRVVVTDSEGPHIVNFKLNAAKDLLVGVEQGGDNVMLILGVKAPAVTGSRQDCGLMTRVLPDAMQIYWASGVNRALQVSTNLVDWTTVPGTAGQHFYTLHPGAGSMGCYRVVETN